MTALFQAFKREPLLVMAMLTMMIDAHVTNDATNKGSRVIDNPSLLCLAVLDTHYLGQVLTILCREFVLVEIHVDIQIHLYGIVIRGHLLHSCLCYLVLLRKHGNLLIVSTDSRRERLAGNYNCKFL